MLPVFDFVGALAVAGKTFKEIEETIKPVHGDKDLTELQLYEIIKKVKEGKLAANQRLFNSKRKLQDLTFVADVALRSPVTGMLLSKNLLRPVVCQPKRFTPLSTGIFTSQKSRPDGFPNFSTRR
jgi:hypothetical protein